MNIQTDVGIAHADIRAGSGGFTKLIDDGIFHFVGDKARVAKLFGVDHRVDTECLSMFNILAPVNFPHFIVHVFSRASFEMRDGFQDSDGCSELEVRPIHHLLIACKRHHATAYLYVVGS